MTADPIWFRPAPRPTHIPAAPERPAPAQVAFEIDGRPVTVPEGSTILEACRTEGIETPTLCFLENLTPVNVCRVCVVELEGARVLAPACSRKVEAGMKVHTDSERVRTSRKVVLELLGSSVDLSTAPEVAGYMARYGADPSRFAAPGALMFRSEHEMRAAGTWDEAAQTRTDTICPYCGVGCTLTLHVQENDIVKVTSPLDADVTNGHLCVKGRFGFAFVQERPTPE